MSTPEIQQKLLGSTGAVYFSPGVYWLTDSLPVQSGRTYIGAGSPDPRLGSILIQTATDSSGLGVPIFIVGANCPQNLPATVTITGLTFDGVPAANARAIAAGSLDQFNKLIPASDSFGELQGWKIRGNYFMTGLREAIDIPMVLTRIEGNKFGVIGPNINSRSRHINSVYPQNRKIPAACNINIGPEQTSNANWVAANVFANAQGSESVLFEAGLQVHMVGNRFLGNNSDHTVQINGMFQVVIYGNDFEGNRGDYLVKFANSRHFEYVDGLVQGNFLTRFLGNQYDLSASNKYIFNLQQNTDDGQLTHTYLFMGGETGKHFSRPGISADITDPLVADSCNPVTGKPIYLSIVGPFNIPDYTAKNKNCCGPNELTPCQ